VLRKLKEYFGNKILQEKFTVRKNKTQRKPMYKNWKKWNGEEVVRNKDTSKIGISCKKIETFSN
jgi:hypothetical protein